MRRNSSRLIASTGLLCALVAISVSAGEEEVKSKSASGESVLVVNGLDPVLLIAGEKVAGKPEWNAIHQKFRYQFATKENLKQFQENPSRYAVQNNGEAVGFPGTMGTPDVFDVYQGKLYLFCTQDCKKIFWENPQKWTKEKRKVAIFLYPGVELLDFAGPGEVFAAVADGTEFEVFTVAATAEPIVSQGFLKIVPKYTIHNAPKADIVVIPGGHTQASIQNPDVIAWVQKSAGESEIVLSVCTGAFLLGKAGLLDGQKATTHWYFTERLEQEFPQASVKPGDRFIDNGKVVTAAGVSAGIDGALHIVERLFGKELAKETARYMEYARTEK